MATIDVMKRPPGESDLPISPIVNIHLSSYSQREDAIVLSPDLMSAGEVDESVDYLIEQLERARVKAKSMLE